MKRRSSKLKTSCIISIMWFYPSCIGNYIILYSECRLVFYQCKVKPVRFRWSRSTWGKKKECLLSPLLHVHLYWFFVPNNYSVTYTLYTWSSFVKKNAHVFHILTRVTQSIHVQNWDSLMPKVLARRLLRIKLINTSCTSLKIHTYLWHTNFTQKH